MRRWISSPAECVRSDPRLWACGRDMAALRPEARSLFQMMYRAGRHCLSGHWTARRDEAELGHNLRCSGIDRGSKESSGTSTAATCGTIGACPNAYQ
jgi:hypothetical protein